MEIFFISIYRQIQQHRRAFILFGVLIFLICFYSVSRLKISENITDLIPENEYTASLQEIMSSSDVVDRLLILIHTEGSSKQSIFEVADSVVNCLSSERYADYLYPPAPFIDEKQVDESYDFFYRKLPLLMSESDWSYLRSQSSPDSLGKVMKKNLNALISPSGIVVKKYIARDPLHLAARQLGKLNELRLISSLKQEKGYLVSEDGESVLLMLNHKTDLNDTQVNTIFLHQLTKDLEKISSRYACPIYTYGALVATVENARTVKRDVWLTVTVSLVLLLLLVGSFFKNIRSIVVMFIPCMLAALGSLTLIQVTQGSLSAIILGIGAVLMGIAIDYSLHLGVHFRISKDIQHYYKGTVRPLVISCITSSGAFFLMFILDAPALRVMGFFAGSTIFFSALLALVLMPHLLPNKKSTQKPLAWLDCLASFPFHKKQVLVVALLVLTLVSGFYVSKVEFEGDLSGLGYESEQSKVAREQIEAVGSVGHKTVYVSSCAENFDEALRNGQNLLSVFEQLKEEELIEHYVSLAKIYPCEEEQKKRWEQWREFWSEASGKELIRALRVQGEKYGFKAEAFSAFESLVESNEVGTLDYESLKSLGINKDLLFKQGEKYHVLTIIKVKEENKQALFSALPEEGLVVFDKNFYSSRLIEVLRESFGQLSIWSLVFIALFLCLAYGRVELALVNLIPIGMSWIITLGMMAWIGLKINIFNLIIATVIFGLGIDYSVFLMHGLLQERLGAGELKHYKYSILLSMFTTLIGIGSLALAKHPALQSIAHTAILGIITVVVCTFSIQIPLYRFLFYSGKKRRETPLKLSDLLLSVYIFVLFLMACAFLSTTVLLLRLCRMPKPQGQAFMHTLVFRAARLVLAIVPIKLKVEEALDHAFQAPEIVTCNHQSHLDILILLSLSPRMILLTKDWVWRNPFYGFFIRYLEFYPASDGIEQLKEPLEEKIRAGYSIVVFPEGTRSEYRQIQRFKQGAIELARTFSLPVRPVLIHGLGEVMPKHEIMIKKTNIFVKIFPSITLTSDLSGELRREQAKALRKFYVEQLKECHKRWMNPRYFSPKVAENALYHYPETYWYVRTKLRMENNYRVINRLVPCDAKVLDIGCGYGYVSLMLYLCSPQRKIRGFDIDEDKIALAQSSFYSKFIDYQCCRVEDWSFEKSDVFMINDVLHYLKPEEQEQLIAKCAAYLEEGGIVIIRESNFADHGHHRVDKNEQRGLKMHFNRLEGETFYYSDSDGIASLAASCNLIVYWTLPLPKTSNTIYVLRRP